jgi:hypothetical protein
MNSTGYKCQRSGIYQSSCCSARIALSYGETFPPCSGCDGGASWTLVQAT